MGKPKHIQLKKKKRNYTLKHSLEMMDLALKLEIREKKIFL